VFGWAGDALWRIRSSDPRGNASHLFIRQWKPVDARRRFSFAEQVIEHLCGGIFSHFLCQKHTTLDPPHRLTVHSLSSTRPSLRCENSLESWPPPLPFFSVFFSLLFPLSLRRLSLERDLRGPPSFSSPGFPNSRILSRSHSRSALAFSRRSISRSRSAHWSRSGRRGGRAAVRPRLAPSPCSSAGGLSAVPLWKSSCRAEIRSSYRWRGIVGKREKLTDNKKVLPHPSGRSLRWGLWGCSEAISLHEEMPVWPRPPQSCSTKYREEGGGGGLDTEEPSTGQKQAGWDPSEEELTVTKQWDLILSIQKPSSTRVPVLLSSSFSCPRVNGLTCTAEEVLRLCSTINEQIHTHIELLSSIGMNNNKNCTLSSRLQTHF